VGAGVAGSGEVERISLMRQLQAVGAVRLEVTVSLSGDYREDDDRRRWRLIAFGSGRTRTYSGRTLEEAVDALLADRQQPVESCRDPFPAEPHIGGAE